MHQGADGSYWPCYLGFTIRASALHTTQCDAGHTVPIQYGREWREGYRAGGGVPRADIHRDVRRRPSHACVRPTEVAGMYRYE